MAMTVTGLSDNFAGTAGTSLVPHVPTAVGSGATQPGAAYTAIGSPDVGDEFTLVSAGGVRVAASSGAAHVVTNAACPAGQFTVTETIEYRAGGPQYSSLGLTIFDDGTGQFFYTARIAYNGSSSTFQILYCKNASYGLVGQQAAFPASLNDGDMLTFATTVTPSSGSVTFNVTLSVNGNAAANFMGAADTSNPLTAGNLGIRGDGPAGSDSSGLILVSYSAPTVTYTASMPAPTKVAVTPATASGTAGSPVSLSVTIDQPAPNGGVAVTLTSSDAGDTFSPASPVTIAVGATSANFTVTSSDAGSHTITPAASGLTATAATITVASPPPLTAVAIRQEIDAHSTQLAALVADLSTMTMTLNSIVTSLATCTNALTDLATVVQSAGSSKMQATWTQFVADETNPATGSATLNALVQSIEQMLPNATIGTITNKVAATLAATDVTGNLPANATQLGGQPVTAAGPITVPAQIGTSTYAGGPVAAVTGNVAGSVGGIVNQPGYSLAAGAVIASPAPLAAAFGSLTTTLSTTPGAYIGQSVLFQSGSLVTQRRLINGYSVTGSGGSAVATLTLAAPFAGVPAVGDSFIIY